MSIRRGRPRAASLISATLAIAHLALFIQAPEKRQSSDLFTLAHDPALSFPLVQETARRLPGPQRDCFFPLHHLAPSPGTTPVTHNYGLVCEYKCAIHLPLARKMAAKESPSRQELGQLYRQSFNPEEYIATYYSALDPEVEFFLSNLHRFFDEHGTPEPSTSLPSFSCFFASPRFAQQIVGERGKNSGGTSFRSRVFLLCKKRPQY